MKPESAFGYQARSEASRRLLFSPAFNGRRLIIRSHGRANRAADKRQSGSSSRRLGQHWLVGRMGGNTRLTHFRRPAAMTEIGATLSSGCVPAKARFPPQADPDAGYQKSDFLR